MQTAETEYYERTGTFGVLRDLGPAGAGLAYAKQSTEVRGGYRFEIDVDLSSGPRYVIRARPVKYAEAGYRSFYADQTGAVRQTFRDEPATAESELIRQ